MRNQKSQTLPLIMIADSDDEERCLLRAVLKLKGFNVIEAVDGQQAINLATEKLPDLLVVDLKLPRVSGSKAIRQIRKKPDLQNLPIVAVSLSQSRSGRKREVAAGSTVHLEKPIEYEQLDTLLDRFLPGKRLLVGD